MYYTVNLTKSQLKRRKDAPGPACKLGAVGPIETPFL